MQSISFTKDIKSRLGRYLKDLWQCSAVSFSGGNAFYAAATGAIGEFVIGALPSVALQFGITTWIAADQAKATYNGQGYNTPFRRLAYANWATAAILLCGAATAGTLLAIAIAALPAAVLAEWGRGHWDLSRMLSRIEKLNNSSKEGGLNEDQIRQKIEADPLVSKYLKRFQMHYGIADCGAVITATVKGESIQAVASQAFHGLMSWESIVPLALFGIGLAKALSKKAG